MWSVRWFVPLLLLVPLSAAASARATVSKSDLLRVSFGDRKVEARAGAVGYGGENIALAWRGQRLTGRWLNQAVELQTSRVVVDGQLGGRPLLARISRAVTGGTIALALDGQLGGEPIALRVTPTWIRGLAGDCTYSLGLAGQAYRGWRDCDLGGTPQAVELELPVVGGHDDDGGLAAVLLVALAPRADELGPAPSAVREEVLEDRFGLSLGDAPGGGARVQRVRAGSEADAAGLVAGMVIEAAGGEPVTTAADLELRLSRLAAGQRLTLGCRWPGLDVTKKLAISAPPLRW